MTQETTDIPHVAVATPGTNIAGSRTVPSSIHAEQHPGAVRRILGFLGWILSGFGLLGFFTRRRAGGRKGEEIVIYTVHQSFYLWLIILVGFVGGECVKHSLGSPLLWGWVWVF